MDNHLLKQVVISKLKKEAAASPKLASRIGSKLAGLGKWTKERPGKIKRGIADHWRKYLIGAGVTAGLGGSTAAGIAALRGGDPVREFASTAPWGLVPMGPMESIIYPGLFTASDPSVGRRNQHITPIQIKRYKALQDQLDDVYHLPDVPTL